MNTDKQHENTEYKHLKKYQWKPGQSGNLKGRPPGKTLKEYTRERLANMPEEERLKFLNSIFPETAWRMAEGNPTNELTGKDGGPIQHQISELKVKIQK